MASWEWYQGDGKIAPFGFDRGWFVNWSLDESGELGYELEPDEMAEEDDEIADEDDVRRRVDEWLAAERRKESSHALDTLFARCCTLARDAT
jgi:hypothetical protein